MGWNTTTKNTFGSGRCIIHTLLVYAATVNTLLTLAGEVHSKSAGLGVNSISGLIIQGKEIDRAKRWHRSIHGKFSGIYNGIYPTYLCWWRMRMRVCTCTTWRTRAHRQCRARTHVCVCDAWHSATNLIVHLLLHRSSWKPTITCLRRVCSCRGLTPVVVAVFKFICTLY